MFVAGDQVGAQSLETSRVVSFLLNQLLCFSNGLPCFLLPLLQSLFNLFHVVYSSINLTLHFDSCILQLINFFFAIYEVGVVIPQVLKWTPNRSSQALDNIQNKTRDFDHFLHFFLSPSLVDLKKIMRERKK
ncbi:hypothetical protein Pint_21515 [Pistacia integerrima]|uniref:Uncharacterized protein n=1 Tax=Pistacia integerrima TaxID=434235 RepID=A0ACC0XCV7_9ROSI|nr:hypothetical protein Pint_21515 [Pistacia integerrima]